MGGMGILLWWNEKERDILGLVQGKQSREPDLGEMLGVRCVERETFRGLCYIIGHYWSPDFTTPLHLIVTFLNGCNHQ